MTLFESVVDEYEAGRPGYPASIFDALEPLEGSLVVEGGAGTGIATRDLLRRGATVVAVDPGANMLIRALSTEPRPVAVLADAARIPMSDSSADVVCFAQSWHWLDPETRVNEMRRVLRVGGRWAGWWNHARADHEPWFNRYWDAVEATCPGVSRTLRDHDFVSEIASTAGFGDVDAHRVWWTRHLTIDAWLSEVRSLSYVSALRADTRGELVGRLASIVEDRFPDGNMELIFRTDLSIVQRVG